MSGVLQQGYSFGYVLAACSNLGVGDSTNSWKTVFWIGAGFSILVGLVRVCFPESKQFLDAKKEGKAKVAPGAFWAETKVMLKSEWVKFKDEVKRIKHELSLLNPSSTFTKDLDKEN